MKLIRGTAGGGGGFAVGTLVCKYNGIVTEFQVRKCPVPFCPFTMKFLNLGNWVHYNFI